MELIIKTNNEGSIAKIIALAKKLNVIVEQKEVPDQDKINKDELKKSILNFKASGPPSFGDAAEWQRKMRKDRDLPFSE
ncbi:hypothetical protein [Mucilaginibacter gotjawali]|uniref:Uncharacterized protein n=2 Tax=Mucilaginibacter gotjawali TaxID=1550579 RepID=A0A120MZ43_9SPHI|nr:hypothetical protein [Mucilaginibacter gotjawali]MBB3056461.1 hypothetical protein [Mucilaginibacter gotjawali]BAU55168.1 hypothetical protein MgSA37_03349 [Mucilaginibacter gotjawali]